MELAHRSAPEVRGQQESLSIIALTSLAVGRTSGTVTHTGDTAGHQREPEAVQHRVDGLQRDVAHLHPPRSLLVGHELVAERVGQPQLPGDVGQVERPAVLLLHPHLPVHGAQGGGAVGGAGVVRLSPDMRTVLGPGHRQDHQEEEHHSLQLILGTRYNTAETSQY